MFEDLTDDDLIKNQNHYFLENTIEKKLEIGGINFENAMSIIGLKNYLLEINNNEIFNREYYENIMKFALQSVLVFGPESVSYERSRRVRRAKMLEISARIFLGKIQKCQGSMIFTISLGSLLPRPHSEATPNSLKYLEAMDNRSRFPFALSVSCSKPRKTSGAGSISISIRGS